MAAKSLDAVTSMHIHLYSTKFMYVRQMKTDPIKREEQLAKTLEAADAFAGCDEIPATGSSTFCF